MERLTSFADLLELQQVDARIDQLLQDRRSLPELAAHAQARRAAQVAAAALEESTNLLRSLDRDITRLDHELLMGEQRLAEQERRLFAGGMNAREAQNMRTDVDSLRRRISTIEDELLELLEQREGRQEKQKVLQKEADSTKEVERDLASRITEARSAIDASVGRHRERHGELAGVVAPELLRMYQRLRERRGGIVVGEISGRVCGACHLAMSVGEYDQIREDTIPQCIHCAAILVF